MMIQTFPFRLIAAVIMACLLSMPAAGEDDMAVVEVTVVKIYGSTSEYLEKVKGIIDVIMKHEPRAEVHIYQAAFCRYRLWKNLYQHSLSELRGFSCGEP